MAKDRSEEPSSKVKREKKEKKDKKRKHSEVVADEGTVGEAESRPAKREKKEKKEKKEKRKSASATHLTPEQQEKDGGVPLHADGAVKVEGDDDDDDKENKESDVKVTVPLAALVPFANPLCDEKAQKKVLRGVKKAAKNKALKRGVKEVVKAIRKSPPVAPSATNNPSITPSAIVILAADISPMDVISHIPVLCEDHSIPYLYVPSRAELGAAGATKRPTSVVMMGPKQGKGVKGEAGAEAEWEEAYKDLYKLSLKLGQHVKV